MHIQTTMTEITEFIKGPVDYDKCGGQYFWIKDPKGGRQMLAEMRGWGAIQNMPQFKNNMQAAEEFQDQIGKFIADAINEKIEREKLSYLFNMCHNHHPNCYSGVCPNCNTDITQP